MKAWVLISKCAKFGSGTRVRTLCGTILFEKNINSKNFFIEIFRDHNFNQFFREQALNSALSNSIELQIKRCLETALTIMKKNSKQKFSSI